MKNTKILIAFAVFAFAFCSCNDFLDELPDSRTTLDSEEKLEALLVSAYAASDYQMITEVSSDNIDDCTFTSSYTTRFIEELFYWEDGSESNNESPENVWQANYNAIACANEVLQAIDEMGGATTTTLAAIQAEALLCRAYAHWTLLNVFSLNYNTSSSSSDLGVTYMTEPETTLVNEYERSSVAECYELIAADLETALPNVSDDYYSVPKYHFNTSAAYAFASKFYLFYEQWDKAIEYADKVLGSNPSTVIRDYTALATNSTYAAQSQAYIDATENANLLLMTGYSYMGPFTGPYYTYKRFTHSYYLANTETTFAKYPFGTLSQTRTVAYARYYPALYGVLFWRNPYLFEYTDKTAGIGYSRCVFNVFSTDETLLNRAEAEIMLEDYDSAISDLNIWLHNFTTFTTELTVDDVVSYYNSIDYYTWDSPTVKKHLNPSFDIGAEGDTKECMLQYVLGMRRLETMHLGQRWFDIKRYGIEISRRVMASSGSPEEEVDVLTADDPRRAIQIPSKVRAAGYEANPR